MPVQIALLRGVNVGARNRIRMADLRAALEAAGFSRVETYIQSGNVLFDSTAPTEVNARAVSSAIADRFGADCPAVVRTSAELCAILNALPFTVEEIARAKAVRPDVECLYAFLFPSELPPETRERLARLPAAGERLAFAGREAYVLLNGGVRLSKLAAALQNPRFGGTARNLSTLFAIADLAKRRENPAE